MSKTSSNPANLNDPRLRTMRGKAIVSALLASFSACLFLAATPANAQVQVVPSPVPVGAVGRSTPSGALLWRQSENATRTGDVVKASEFAKKSCLAGAAVACSRSGELLVSDLLGPPNPSQAANHFDIGCQLGNANACHAIGLMLMQGIGIGADILGGRRALQTSCDNGNTMGCTNLGSIVSGGVYGPPDCQLAKTLFQRAIELWPDNAQAKTRLNETAVSC